MLVADNRFSVRILQAEGQTAELGTLSAIGTASETGLTDITLSAITYAQRSMHKHFERHCRTHFMNLLYLLQREFAGQHYP